MCVCVWVCVWLCVGVGVNVHVCVCMYGIERKEFESEVDC